MPSHSQISAVRRWKRHLRRLAWTLTMLGLCFLFGRHLLLTWVVAPVAGLALGTSVDVSQASCAPTSRLDLSDLRVGEADNVFIQTGPVEARYRLWRSLFIGPYVERLHATNLTVNLANAPQEKMRLPRFRWFRRKHKEDIEDAEPFLVRDLVLTNSTLLYESDDSPLHMRLEDASVNMPEMRHGTPGQFSVQARIARLDVGPLSLDGGEISGTCTMSHDREMDLQWNTYRFQASNLSGTLDGTSLQGVSLTVEGSGRMQRGRGFRQDITLTFAHDGDPVGTVELSGYYSKNLRGLDVTARLDVGPEFANAALAKLGLPAQAAPHVSVAARLDFPQPGQGRLDAAINVETSGETIADLDLSITSPVPPILQPVQVRITSERLAIDQLLAIYQPSDDQPDEADQPVPPIDSEQAASHPDEALPAPGHPRPGPARRVLRRAARQRGCPGARSRTAGGFGPLHHLPGRWHSPCRGRCGLGASGSDMPGKGGGGGP
jgi:hypothetical protein